MKLRSVLGEAQAGKAECRRLPQPAHRRCVDAARCVPHVVGQVDLGGLAEIALCERDLSQARRYQGVNGRT